MVGGGGDLFGPWAGPCLGLVSKFAAELTVKCGQQSLHFRVLFNLITFIMTIETVHNRGQG